MAMRQWPGAIALAIAPILILPAEAAMFRIQTRPLIPDRGRVIPAPDLTPDPPLRVVPAWMDWVLRLVDGRAFAFAQASGEGSLADLRWRVGLEAGLKGRVAIGFGPALVLNGLLSGPVWGMNGQLTVLANPTGGVSWLSEATLGRPPWALHLRAWNGPGASSVGRSATVTLRLGF